MQPKLFCLKKIEIRVFLKDWSVKEREKKIEHPPFVSTSLAEPHAKEEEN